MEKKHNNRITIKPKDYQRDYFVIVVTIIFWIIWTPITMIATYLLFIEPSIFLILWLSVGYFGVIGVPFALGTMNRCITIELIDDKINVVIATSCKDFI